MTRIILVRHCEAAGNLNRRFQGHTDAEVTENGKKQLELRMKSCVDRIAGEHPGKTVCIATHGCAIRNFLCYAGGKPIEELNSVEWCDNTAVSVVEYDDSFVPHIVSQNDASHLNPEVSTFEKQDWWRPEKKKGSA